MNSAADPSMPGDYVAPGVSIPPSSLGFSQSEGLRTRSLYVDLDMGDAGGEQRRALAPSFKVQDITVTGNLIMRMPVQAMVMERDYGVNLSYTSAFDEQPTDLPDEDA